MLIAASKDNAHDLVRQVVELTDVARQFLDARFADFDKDRDGVLSRAELDEMYSTSPSRSALLSPRCLQLAAPFQPILWRCRQHRAHSTLSLCDAAPGVPPATFGAGRICKQGC